MYSVRDLASILHSKKDYSVSIECFYEKLSPLLDVDYQSRIKSLRQLLYSITSHKLFSSIEHFDDELKGIHSDSNGFFTLDELLSMGVKHDDCGQWRVPAEWGYLALINDACGDHNTMYPDWSDGFINGIVGLLTGEKQRNKTITDLGMVSSVVYAGLLLLPYLGGPPVLFDPVKYSVGIPMVFYLSKIIAASYNLGRNFIMDKVYINEWVRLNDLRRESINNLINYHLSINDGVGLSDVWDSIQSIKQSMRQALSNDRFGEHSGKPLSGVLKRNALFSGVGTATSSLEVLINAYAMMSANPLKGIPYLGNLMLGFSMAYSLYKTAWNGWGMNYYHRISKRLRNKIELMPDNEAVWELFDFLNRFKSREKTGRLIGMISGTITNIILTVGTVLTNPETIYDVGTFMYLTLGIANGLVLPSVLNRQATKEKKGVDRLIKLKNKISFI